MLNSELQSSHGNHATDRLVCGRNDKGIQRRLLADSGMTFKRASELSQGLETAARNVKELKPVIKCAPDSFSTGLKQNIMCKVSTTEKSLGSSTATITCFRCRIAGHLEPQCEFKGFTQTHQYTFSEIVFHSVQLMLGNQQL